LFNIYINDLALLLKNSNKGIPINEDNVAILLLYADDIVLIAENEENLQFMLDLFLIGVL
jgi:hypothetical protein